MNSVQLFKLKTSFDEVWQLEKMFCDTLVSKRANIIAQYGGDPDAVPNKDIGEFEETMNSMIAEFNLDKNGVSHDRRPVKEDSKKFPNHHFKIGYFFSSPGTFGFNNIMQCTLGIKNAFLHIFDQTKINDIFVPNWQEASKKTQEILCAFQFFIEKNEKIAVREISPSREMMNNILSTMLSNVMPREEKNETLINLNQEQIHWYIKALMIIAETCQFVGAQINTNSSEFCLLINGIDNEIGEVD